MKKVFVFIILLLAGSMLLSQPKIEFENFEYDFGEIKEENGPHKVEFKFSNTGDKPFHLIEVKAG